jgi:hypothetical protein
MARDLSGVEFEVLEAERLSPARREELFGLFQGAYRQANWAFLDRSLAQLRHVAIASSEGHPVGFALAETRRIDLPRLPAQLVTLAGICCIASEYRRRGLFGQLELLAAEEEGVSGEGRRLFCGRMAHPAALRAIARLPGAVPQPGRTPTPWQQEVGAAIADTYGVHDFDPGTFVCVGDGQPIGYPKIEIDVEPREWEVFKPVDRNRGDALLGLGWAPDDPPGWGR